MSDMDGAICHECIGDPFLKARVKEEGRVSRCEQCSRRRKAVPIERLKGWLDEVFQDHFEPGPGADAETIFAEIAGISQELATELVEDLSSGYGYLAARGKTDDPYEFESYDECGPGRDDADDRWRGFQTRLRQEARFFNREAEEWLDHIFTGLHDQRTWSQEGVIWHVDVGGVHSSFFRGRVAPTELKVGQILSDPMRELGPPPNGSAAPGRMNAAGVSVFYGAEDTDTCISEIRAPVGSSVVIGRFDLLRPIRLLDFDLLAHLEPAGSHFDPQYHAKRDRVHFLREFGRQIARPIQPDDEGFGYLPTQVVADYLAQRLSPDIDGILYRSTQTGSKGRNVVVFNRAARVEPLDPSLHIDLGMGWSPDDEHDSSITLMLKKREEVATSISRQEWLDDRPMTWRLDLSSIEVSKIQATRYEVETRQMLLLPYREPKENRGF